jgi:hypothetical protein
VLADSIMLMGSRRPIGDVLPAASTVVLSALVASSVALSALVLGDTALARATPQWPTHRCGAFVHRVHGAYPVNDRITVLNGGVSCQTATGVIRTFWSGQGVSQHGGSSDAQSYWTLAAWPGWRCGQDAGAGSCTRGKAIAAYEVRAT